MIRIAYLLDSWVWIAHFEGRSKEARHYIEGMEYLCMSAITIAEVTQKYSRHGEKMVQTRIDDMLKRCPMIPVDRKIATMAGMLRQREIQGGIADAIILATARVGHHTIVAGDRHFRDLPDVLFIEDT